MEILFFCFLRYQEFPQTVLKNWFNEAKSKKMHYKGCITTKEVRPSTLRKTSPRSISSKDGLDFSFRQRTETAQPREEHGFVQLSKVDLQLSNAAGKENVYE